MALAATALPSAHAAYERQREARAASTIGALVGGGLVYAALAIRTMPASVPSLEQILADPVPLARADISGTRLKTKYFAGPDGSRFAIAEVLWDSELQFDCSFRTAADGTLRCLPFGPDPGWGSGGWGFVHFTDAACTNGATWVPLPSPGCEVIVPEFVINSTDPPYCSGEPAREHIYRVGALIAGPLSQYRINGSGECVAGSVTPNQGILYALEAEMPASSFAEGTAGIDP